MPIEWKITFTDDNRFFNDYSVIKRILAIPTKDGNGFKKGKQYLFIHHRDYIYKTIIHNKPKYEDFDTLRNDSYSINLSQKKSHDKAGTFKFIKAWA